MDIDRWTDDVYLSPANNKGVVYLAAENGVLVRNGGCADRQSLFPRCIC